MRWSAATAALCFTLAASDSAVAATVTAQREGVLGTSFEMQVTGTGRRRAARAVAAALAEIARLENQLSTWRADSALSAYNDGRLPAEQLPADAAAVLQRCEQWRRESAGAFSCRLGALIAQWRQADASDTLPQRAELRRQARALAALPLPSQGPLAAASGLRFDVDAIAKGYVIDRALEQARKAAPRADGIRIDIGGDAVYWGRAEDGKPWRVAVADPQRPLDNAAGIAEVRLSGQAIAASGHHSRGYRIGRRQFSHILDPQEGWPLSYAPAATVVARDAATADALATALTVLPIRDGLALADRVDGAAALIVSDAGVSFASARWPALLAPGPAPLPQQVQVDYEIPASNTERYRQPYLALWIERTDGSAVRQLLVLGDRSRWLSELPRWWRHYGRNDAYAALGIARPTRAPGRYSVGWDGRNDRGQAQAEGAYVLRVEAAREYGGHEDLTLPFVLGAANAGQHGHAQHGHAQHGQGRSEIGRVEIRLAHTRHDSD